MMMKFLLLIVVGLLGATFVTSYKSVRGPKSCGLHGDACGLGCCDGFQCNAKAGRCMATITVEMLQEARSKLRHVETRHVRQASCGKHGDSCSQGCCDGFSCNAYAGKCMARITAEMLQEARSKLRHVERRPPRQACGAHGDPCSEGCCDGFFCNNYAGKCMARITTEELENARSHLSHIEPRSLREACGKHGDSCDQGCCDGFFCNDYAGKCMARITAEELEDARLRLKHFKSKQLRQACGKHGDPCSEGCCAGYSCNEYADRCMIIIEAEDLEEARTKLKYDELRRARDASCGKHGDSCDQGCCDGFFCNDYAGKCMARITAEELEDARSKLKHVESRPSRQVCGKHGDSCNGGCCNGFFCNDYVGKCMAKITAEELEDARFKLEHVEPRLLLQPKCGKHGDSCNGGCCDGFTCNRFAEKCMVSLTPQILQKGYSNLKSSKKLGGESSPATAA